MFFFVFINLLLDLLILLGFLSFLPGEDAESDPLTEKMIKSNIKVDRQTDNLACAEPKVVARLVQKYAHIAAWRHSNLGPAFFVLHGVVYISEIVVIHVNSCE